MQIFKADVFRVFIYDARPGWRFKDDVFRVLELVALLVEPPWPGTVTSNLAASSVTPLTHQRSTASEQESQAVSPSSLLR